MHQLNLSEMQAVQTINTAIDSQDPAQLLRALQAPTAQLPEVLDFAGGLYMEEFNSVKADKEVTSLRESHKS